jgi:phytanoyl-CoA hydroxylase
MPTETTSPPTSSPQLPPDCFSTDEVEQFHRDGYFIVRGMGDASTRETMLAVARAHLEQPIEPVELEADVHYPGAPASRAAAGGRTVRRLLMAHARHPVFTQWICSPGVAGRLSQLLAAPVVMPLSHHNCIMTKQPQYSSHTHWHQDIRFWSFEQPNLVSMWLALRDETPGNGCLSVIPGTHVMQFANDRFDAGCFLDPTQPQNRKLIDRRVEVELAPGDVLFFHSRLFHAAGNNATDESKFSVVFTFRPADNHPLPGTRSAALAELLLPVT